MRFFLTLCLIANLVFFAGCSSKNKAPEWHKNEKFVKAIEISDYNSVSGFIYTSPLNLQSKNADGETPLTFAVKNTDDARIIKVILEAGAAPEAPNADGQTPLLLAAKYNINPNIAKAILTAGADIERADKKNRTPLIVAAENNKNKNVVRLLLSAGAKGRDSQAFAQALSLNPNISEEDAAVLLNGKLGNTVKIPWYNSKAFKDAWSAENLKALAAVCPSVDLAAVNPDTKKDAAFLLQNNKNINLLSLFAKGGANINFQDDKGRTLLYKAAQENDETWLKALLKAKADPNIRAKDKTTPLMAAAENYPQSKAALEALIKGGANLNAGYNREGSTMLYKLIEENKDIKLIEFLLEAGAEVNLKNVLGNTPLMTAAQYSQDEKIIDLLLKHKANIDAKNNQGFTALLTAAANNSNPKVVLALFTKSTNKLDESHALEFAAQNPNKEVYNALINHLNEETFALKNPKDPNDPSVWFSNKALVSAIKSGSAAAIKKELKKELNLEALMQGQFNALMLAATFAKTEEPINLLVEAGADVNGANNNNDTPLMAAALTNKNLPVFQALIEAGADVNATDKKGTSIIMAAVSKNPNEKVPVVLLQGGATVPDTQMLLQYAKQNPNPKVYEVLKKLFTKNKKS